MVFFRLPFQKGVHCVSFETDMLYSEMIRHYITSYLGSSDFVLSYNGKMLLEDQQIPQDANVLVTFSLLGGKGGFGSMLRAIGAQIEKTTNREACRDLSGRRLRDINEEQRLKKWISKEGDREAEKVRRRRERIERLKSKPKHNFNDFEFEKKISQLPDRIDDAVTAGMQKVNKRKAQEAEASCSAVRPKKKRVWMGDVSESSGSDSDTSNSDSREAIHSSSCDVPNSEVGCSIMSDSCIENMSLQASGSESSEASSSSHCIDAKVPNIAESPTLEEQPTSIIDMESITEVEMSKEARSIPVEADCSSSIQSKLSWNPESDAASSSNEIVKDVDLSPVDLFAFESSTDLESLGLDRLKLALMERGLKCGGNISDRARRLWSVRGLEPHQYPSSVLAKKKK